MKRTFLLCAMFLTLTLYALPLSAWGGDIYPKTGSWMPTPALPGWHRTFSNFQTRLISGRRTFRYYINDAQTQYYDNIYAVIHLAAAGGISSGDLVFLAGEDLPIHDLDRTSYIVLFYPRSDYAAVLATLRAHKSGAVYFDQFCESSGDTRACYIVGQLYFDTTPAGSIENSNNNLRDHKKVKASH